jgi:Zinc dependent phospholipase C
MRLRRLLYVIMILTISSVFILPTSDAWSWKTHSDIVDVVYYGLPVDIQQKLDLNAMIDGSNDPDEKFHDFTYHSYPKSYEKAKMWLDQGKAAYDNGDYSNASYDYGVASHYISDTFSAPHTVSRENYADHSKYDNHAKKLTPVATSVNGDLNALMHDGKNQGAVSWNSWLQSHDDSIIQNDLNKGASVALYAVKDSINNTNSNTPKESFVDYVIRMFKSLFK